MDLIRALRLATGVVAIAVVGAGAALLLRVGKPAGSGSTSRPRPSVLLVTLDTVRADHTSAYGYRRPTTPGLERLAREGVRLGVAYAPMATTSPSHATMLTSLEPRTHGVTRNGQRLSSRHVTLAEVLARHGYRTAAVVSSFPVARRFGLAQGFAMYDDNFSEGHAPEERVDERRVEWEGMVVRGVFDRRGDETRARAIAWLRANGYLASERPPQPFFLWVHFFDPHNPYEPPPEDAALFPPEGDPPSDLDRQVALYDADIHFADRQLSALLDRLDATGLTDRLLVVVAGDHGEGLMDHGWMFHGLTIYEEAVRVPLVFRWPGVIPAGRRVDAPVELLDLAPTILDLAGAGEALPRAQGVSLAALLKGESEGDPERPIFTQRRSYQTSKIGDREVAGEKVAVRAGRWKYIEAPEERSFELYDLESDPRELENVHAGHPQVVAGLEARIRGWRSLAGAAPPPAKVSAEDARRLRALGYVQ